MRLSKYSFDVSADGLARLVRHLASGGVHQSLQVGAVGPRFHVVLTASQLASLEQRERATITSQTIQMFEHLNARRERPHLGEKYD